MGQRCRRVWYRSSMRNVSIRIRTRKSFPENLKFACQSISIWIRQLLILGLPCSLNKLPSPVELELTSERDSGGSNHTESMRYPSTMLPPLLPMAAKIPAFFASLLKGTIVWQRDSESDDDSVLHGLLCQTTIFFLFRAKFTKSIYFTLSSGLITTLGSLV